MSEQEKDYQSPMAAAASTVGSWFKGAVSGAFTGGAVVAVVDAAINIGTQLYTGGTAGFEWQSLGDSALGGLGAGAAFGAAIGGVAGAAAGWMNTRRDNANERAALAEERSRSQSRDMARDTAVGMIAARVEQMEHEQSEISTQWRDRFAKLDQSMSQVERLNQRTQEALENLAKAQPMGHG